MDTNHDELDSSAKVGALKGVKALLIDLFESLFSADRPTRRTALLFFLSVFGLVTVSVIGVQRLSHVRALRAIEEKQLALEHQRLADLHNNRLADLKTHESTVSLGRFVVSLKSESHSSPHTADFAIFVRCIDQEVREYVEARSVQVRSELTSALVGMRREDFLVPDGKRRTHKKILATLNQWLTREYSGARIEDVWFSDLVVE